MVSKAPSAVSPSAQRYFLKLVCLISDVNIPVLFGSLTPVVRVVVLLFFFSSTKVWLFTPHHISRATVAVPLAYSIQRQHWLWGVMWSSGLGLAQKQKNSGYFWKTPAWKLPCQPSYRSKWGSELINFMSSNSIILTLLRILPTLIITLLGILND